MVQPLNKPLTSQTDFFNNDKNDIFRQYGAGIQSITTQFKSNYGLQEVVINWKFWDINKFQEYESLLKHGRTVFVEFGWSNNKEVDIQPDILSDSEEFHNRIKTQIKK